MITDKLLTAMVITLIICFVLLTVSLLLFVIHSIWGK